MLAPALPSPGTPACRLPRYPGTTAADVTEAVRTAPHPQQVRTDSYLPAAPHRYEALPPQLENIRLSTGQLEAWPFDPRIRYRALLVRPAHRFIRPWPRRLLSHVLSPYLCRPPALLCKHPIRSGDRPRGAESGTSARMRHWLIRARDTATSLDGGRLTAVDAGRLQGCIGVLTIVSRTRSDGLVWWAVWNSLSE